MRDARIRATDLLDDRTAVPSPERVDEDPAHRHDWLAQVPQADERDVDGRRMTSAWERLSTPEPDGAVLLVTHAFVVG
jgi:broad specificity phosphatase PhoE